jgi:hypothetical protein
LRELTILAKIVWICRRAINDGNHRPYWYERFARSEIVRKRLQRLGVSGIGARSSAHCCFVTPFSGQMISSKDVKNIVGKTKNSV